jgi:hypothetical protein
MKLVSLAVLAAFATASAASAAVVAGSETCGELPNAKWSWNVNVGEPVLSGGEITTSTGDVEYNKPGTVGTVLVTTTTAPTISTSTTTCTAINPQGKINAEHSTSLVSSIVADPGGSTSSSQTVCNPGNSLPNCPL